MNCKFKCPNATRIIGINGLVCKAFMKDGIDYTKMANAKNCICLYQQYCFRTQQMENTETAKNCYQSRKG